MNKIARLKTTSRQGGGGDKKEIQKETSFLWMPMRKPAYFIWGNRTTSAILAPKKMAFADYVSGA